VRCLRTSSSSSVRKAYCPVSKWFTARPMPGAGNAWLWPVWICASSLSLASRKAMFAFQTTSSPLADSGESSRARVVDHRGAEDALGPQDIHVNRVQVCHVN
jgi:hypothetical protein